MRGLLPYRGGWAASLKASGPVALAMVALATGAANARADDRAGEHKEPPVRIELRSEAHVKGAMVSLGDVAAITTLDRAVLERLMALPLGSTPRTGTSLRLERGPLVRWIRARTAVAAEDIAWAGASETIVWASVETLSGAAIAERAAAALSAAVSGSGLRAEAVSPVIPADVEVPSGAVELRPRAVPRALVSSRRPSVWVDVLVDGRFVRAVPVTFDLAVAGPGYVARDSHARGEVLEAAALEVREVSWSGTEALPVGDPAAKLRFRRQVEAGAVVARSDVEPAPLVRRGDFATLRAREGLVSLEKRVKVLADGRQGQSIRVRAAGSRETILARVVGPEALEVVR